MRRQLERDHIILKEKLAAVEKRIQNHPDSRHLKDVRSSYLRAISSAESTLQIVNNLDPIVLNNVAKIMKTQKV